MAKLRTHEVTFERKNMLLGDIQVTKNNCNLIIERKTLNDFSSSIVDGRYNEQKQRLLQSGASIVYLIEGHTKNSHGVPLSTLISIMYTMQCRDNVIVMRSFNIDESVSIIQTLCKKFDADNKQEHKELKIVKKCHGHVYLNMLCCIPGVSVSIANRLIEKFPNISILLNYITEHKSLECIEKIGPILSGKIMSAFCT